VVKPALLGLTVSQRDVATEMKSEHKDRIKMVDEGERVTWRAVISKGWVTNSLTEDLDFRPTMSGIMLRAFLGQPPESEEARVVRDIVTEMMIRCESDFFNFRSYEWYHAQWECLMTVLKPDTTLSDLYGGTTLVTNTWPGFQQHTVKSPPVRQVTELTHWWPGTPATQYQSWDAQHPNAPIKPGLVLYPTANNHGFDLAVVRSFNGSPYVVCLQLRWSDPRSKTRLTDADVKGCWTAILEDFSSRIKTAPALAKLDLSNICLVVLARRDFIIPIAKLPKGSQVALLDKDE